MIDRRQFGELLEDKGLKQRLRRNLRFAPEEISDWEARDFLVVTSRSRSEGVLLAPLEKLYIVPFQLHDRKANQQGRTEAIICDFCATWQRGSNSAVISFMRSDKSSLSFLCCADLLCSLHIRDKTPQAKLSRTQLRENNSVERRVERLRLRLEAALQRVG